MTTTDDTALTNALGDALAGHRFIEHSPGAGEHLELSPQACVRLAATVLPIIRKAERDAARAERARIVSEVRLWVSVNQQLGEGEEASRLRAVAGDIERLPEETR